MNLFKKILKWVGICIVVLYVGVVIYRMFYFYNLEKTQAVVEKIHSARLTMDDVMGVNLPPSPGDLADATVAGLDANANGIRDDVELAIFEKYPDSAKKRAVSLQYAKALQMEFTQPFLNTEIVVAVIQEIGRADACLADELVPRKNPESFRTYPDLEKINSYIDFIELVQINNSNRIDFDNNFYELTGSYSSLENYCDIDYSKLAN